MGGLAAKRLLDHGPVREDDTTELGLSAREREVLKRLALGESNDEIASELISRSTVKSHLASIYAKLGVRDRQSAIGRAMALRLIG